MVERGRDSSASCTDREINPCLSDYLKVLVHEGGVRMYVPRQFVQTKIDHYFLDHVKGLLGT